MAGNCQKFPEMAAQGWNGWKLLKVTENELKCLDMAENGWNGLTWLDVSRLVRNGYNLLKIAGCG